MQTPFHILPDKALHQFRLVRLQKAPQGLLKEILLIVEPAVGNERLDLPIELVGEIGVNGCCGRNTTDSCRMEMRLGALAGGYSCRFSGRHDSNTLMFPEIEQVPIP